MAAALHPFSFALVSLSLLGSCNSKVNGNNQGFEVVKVKTLKQSSVCSESKVPSRNSLRVVHRLGPCFGSGQGPPDDNQILGQESLRVEHLQNRIRVAETPRNTTSDPLRASLEVILPARNGEIIGGTDYIVTISIGTPPRNQTVTFDTGSHVCWLQCRPCQSCYPQVEPIFDPATSASYQNVPCDDPACTQLHPQERGCVNNICVYRVRYEDSSASTGSLAKDRLALTTPGRAPLPFTNFVFGCGHANTGTFRAAAGLFGLGRGFHSLVTQTSRTLGSAFSYCLPSAISSTGYLTIGRRPAPSPMYTPMLPGTRGDSGLYFIDLVGISVAMRRLHLSPTIFQSVGTIMDSGTLLSYIPAAAYGQLRAAFRSGMSHYRLAPPWKILDTCYYIAGTGFEYPQITLHFTGADLLLRPWQVFNALNQSRYCLAFTTSQNGGVNIIGNIQQRGMEVIYDIQAQRIGFSRGTNCR